MAGDLRASPVCPPEASVFPHHHRPVVLFALRFEEIFRINRRPATYSSGRTGCRAHFGNRRTHRRAATWQSNWRRGDRSRRNRFQPLSPHFNVSIQFNILPSHVFVPKTRLFVPFLVIEPAPRGDPLSLSLRHLRCYLHVFAEGNLPSAW